MKFADLLKQNTASTSAAVLTLGAVAGTGFRTLAQAVAEGELAVGDQSTFMVRDAAGKFEFSLFTVTNATTLTRVEVRRSSNNGAAETFGAGTVVANIPDAEWLSQLLGASDGIELSSLSILPSLVVGDQAVILRAGAAYLAPTSLLGGGTTAPADTTAPTAPTGLASSSVTQAGFTISFTAGTDNVGVQRHEWSLDGTSWTQIASGTTFNVTGRTAGTTYTVRVRTVDTSGNVSTAAILSVTTAAASGDTTAPTMSGSISTSNITSSGYTFTYPAGTDNVGIDHYETSIDGGSTWVSNGTNLSRTVSGRPASTTDNLRVRAHDAAGLTSNVLSGTVTTGADPVVSTYVMRTTNAQGQKINGVSHFPANGSAVSVMGGTDPNKFTRDVDTAVSIYDAEGVTVNMAIKFAWSKSSTVAPISYGDDHVPPATNGGTNPYSNTVITANLIYGDTYLVGSAYIRGTAGVYYLWGIMPNGSAVVYTNGTGSPIGWTLT